MQWAARARALATYVFISPWRSINFFPFRRIRMRARARERKSWHAPVALKKSRTRVLSREPHHVCSMFVYIVKAHE